MSSALRRCRRCSFDGKGEDAARGALSLSLAPDCLLVHHGLHTIHSSTTPRVYLLCTTTASTSTLHHFNPSRSLPLHSTALSCSLGDSWQGCQQIIAGVDLERCDLSEGGEEGAVCGDAQAGCKLPSLRVSRVSRS